MHTFDVLWAGRYYQTWDTENHNHSFFQLVAVEKGAGIVTIEDRTEHFGEHELLLFSPQMNHSVSRVPGSRAPLLLDIKFTVTDEQLAADLLKLAPRLKVSNFSVLLQYFSGIYQESSASQPYYYNCICYYFGLMLAMILRDQIPDRNTLDVGPALPKAIGSYSDVDMNSLVGYIHQNYARIICLDDLAEIANISKSTLIQAFKTVYGTTPIRYINTLRLEKAKELLVNTDSSIGDISELIGFQSLHYFSRYFKNNVGVSPIEYRIRFAKSRFYTYESDAGYLDRHPEP